MKIADFFLSFQLFKGPNYLSEAEERKELREVTGRVSQKDCVPSRGPRTQVITPRLYVRIIAY